MFTEPVSTEIVCQVSSQDHCHILQDHFKQFYQFLADNKFIPNASFVEVQKNVQRCLSGIPVSYNNAVFGCPETDCDLCIENQLRYFNAAQMPFVWFLDEEVSPNFKQKLLDRGFHNEGVYRGVIGILDKDILTAEIPEGYEFKLVTDEETMKEFNEVVCTTFGIDSVGKEAYDRFLWNASKNPVNQMYHWVARRDGKVVSTLSTYIDKDIVSFWNGASRLECRRQGISTALRHFALRDAMSKGCRIGTSYLMSEGLAFGICSGLGYQTMWRFNVFVAPTHEKIVDPWMEAKMSGMIL